MMVLFLGDDPQSLKSQGVKVKPGIIVAVAASAVMLSGCAGVKPEPVQAANGSSVKVLSIGAQADLNNNRIPDAHLREVNPSHFATGMGIAVLGALTGNINSGDFDKENYKGSAVDTLPNPTKTYFVPKAKQSLKRWLDENGKGNTYKQELSIGYATWALIYKDMGTDNSVYQLKYKVLFYKRPESGNAFSAYTVAECAPAPVEAPLSEWHADNYKKVTVETNKYMDACLLEFNNQIPRLLK